jgi:hypothetical protein
MKPQLTAALLGIAAASAVFAAPFAQAEPDTAAYLSVLDKDGVQYGSASKAVELGTAVCGDLRGGAHLMGEAQDIVTSSQGAINGHDAGVIIGAAAAALCPDQEARVQQDVAAAKSG